MRPTALAHLASLARIEEMHDDGAAQRLASELHRTQRPRRFAFRLADPRCFPSRDSADASQRTLAVLASHAAAHHWQRNQVLRGAVPRATSRG